MQHAKILTGQFVRILFAALMVLIASCRSKPQLIDMRPFLIDTDLLPADWGVYSVNLERPLEGLNQDQAVEMFIYYEGDPRKLTRGAITVYRYSSEERLNRWYSWYVTRKLERRPESPRVGLFVPEGVNLQPMARTWQFGCYGTRGIPDMVEPNILCQFIGQYDRHIVDVSINTLYDDDETVSTQEIVNLINIVDQHVAKLETEASDSDLIP